MIVDLPAYVATDSAKTVAYSVVDPSGAVSNAEVLKAIVALIAQINKQIIELQKLILKTSKKK
jgi:conjugal transfer/entry exclusion protein